MVDARNYVDPVDFEKQMKYGIQIVHANGEVRWAYAAKGGHIGETANLNETALFVQKDSAIKALKAARKNGYEDPGMTLQVVGIDYTVVETTDVEKPVVKAGHMLVGFDKDGDEVHYASGRSSLSYRIEWYNVERATIFKSDTEALSKLQECRDWYATKLTEKMAVLADKQTRYAQQKQGKSNNAYYWNQVSDYDIKYAEDDVEKAKTNCDWIETVKVVFNQ
ncbi:hypothetical protein D3C81_1073610 [compost metagenome]